MLINQHLFHKLPYIRKETSTKRMMIDVLIALTPVTFFSIYRFGVDAIIRILLSLITFIVVELVYFLLQQKLTVITSKIHSNKSLRSIL